MKTRVDSVLRSTLTNCFQQGVLKETPLTPYVIEVPNNAAHGHFATNLPMTMASGQRRNPKEIASIIVDHLNDSEGLFEGVEIAGPGFINFRIRDEEWYRALAEIVRLKENYGRGLEGEGQRVLVEFVSANPTGPLHLGHGRGAALGDTLCRILSFRGYQVVREFYINDAGQQVKLLGESIYSRFRQRQDPAYPFPENGYHGEYVLDLAGAVSRKADIQSLPEREAMDLCMEEGKQLMLREIKADLEQFRVPFDVWYSEKSLFESGRLRETLDRIKDLGQLYERDGALWIRTSAFGDDKDRVVQKRDGQFTYFASDLAYHLEKETRGFGRAIDIWGADHHGYVPRIKAGLAAHGVSPQWLTVLLIQLVKLWKGGEEVRMSKRAGTFVSLRELMDEVGVDAVRFVFLTKSPDSPLDFDIDLVKKRDSDNPVFYVQYAHARICSIFRKATEEGMSLPVRPEEILNRLVLEEEKHLIRTLTGFPCLLADVAKTLEAHRLPYYLADLAASFHRYFNLGTKNPSHRIIHPDRDLSLARLALADAVRSVIGTGLRLLGAGTPETM